MDDDDDDDRQPGYDMSSRTDFGRRTVDGHRTSGRRKACRCGVETTIRSPPINTKRSDWISFYRRRRNHKNNNYDIIMLVACSPHW